MELLDLVSSGAEAEIAKKILQWAAPILRQQGADQELEACCEWLVRNYNYPEAGNPLRAARRPNPPSVKERSLQLLETYNTSGVMLTADQVTTICRALEGIDD
jgi:hypothetical protein